MRRGLLLLALPAVAFTIVLGGCGSDSKSTTPNPSAAPGAVTVHAKDTLKFDKAEYRAGPGDVTFDYVNDGSIPHTLDIEGTAFELKVDDKTKTASGSVNLAAGTYTLYCDIPGHRSAGMQAKLVVG
jgi:plastocyanin